jgi:hypothetical protein
VRITLTSTPSTYGVAINDDGVQRPVVADKPRIWRDPLRIAQMDTRGLAITLRDGPMLWIMGPAL